MKNNPSKKQLISNLKTYRQEIQNTLANIESILITNFPEQHSIAYQHWIPQIITALKDSDKWLQRCEYNMDYTIKQLEDRLVEENNQKGITKFIK